MVKTHGVYVAPWTAWPVVSALLSAIARGQTRTLIRIINRFVGFKVQLIFPPDDEGWTLRILWRTHRDGPRVVDAE